MDQIYIDTLSWVTAFIHRNAHAPTFKEIGEGLTISTSTAHYRLTRLKRFGKVKWERGKARSIMLC